jgi:hypothetical protein
MKALLLVLCALLLSACDLNNNNTPTPSPNGEPTQIGGLPSLPGTLPPSVRPCLAADFDAVAGYEGATGSMAGAVSLTNRSTTTCALSGRPGIHLTDAQGNLMPVANLEFNRGESDQTGQTPTPESDNDALLVKPRETVYVFFVWSNWCGNAPGPYTLAVALPGEGGQLNVPALDPQGKPLTLTPRCDQPDATSTISIGPFEKR